MAKLERSLKIPQGTDPNLGNNHLNNHKDGDSDDFRSNEEEIMDLATLYDKQFHEVIGRDPYRCKPWIEHVNLLKSLRPPRKTRQLYRISDIWKLNRVDQAPEQGKATVLLGDVSYENINNKIFKAYEKAVKYIPLSYKVWYNYVKDLVEDISEPFVSDPQPYERVNLVFESCLIHNFAYPTFYLLYGAFLRFQHRITKVRRLYDKALLNIAITQHHLIWDEYLKFVNEVDLLPLGKAVYRRYIQLKPSYREVLYEFLKRHGSYDDAAQVLYKLLNDHTFASESGKSSYDLWIELCELIRDHSDAITSIPVETLIKEGIGKYTDQVATLWIILADIYIVRGQLNIARDTYEEALDRVTTVQDFSIIFDVYAKFLENYAKQSNKLGTDQLETLMTVERLESLVNNRALLLASVKLKQNIHNVYNWINYIQLFKDDPNRMVEIYAEAVQTIDVSKSVGRVTELWARFATFYEERSDLENADKIYEKASKSDFKYVDDLATLWCCWVEMYLRHKQFKKALEISRRSVSGNGKTSISKRLHTSVKLWTLSLDMEQNFGTIETTRVTFNKMVELKVVTPQVALSFAGYLEQHKYFEASFNAFEKCVVLFKWPQLYYLYLPYLTKFVRRYKGTKLERAREIFDQCLYNRELKVPPKFVKYLFYLYASMEEEYGMVKKFLSILDDACKLADKEDQLTLIKFYVAKTCEFFGVTQTRQIYQQCLEYVSDDVARELCSMYIHMERGLGEIDRARAIYVYSSQISDPSINTDFWKGWREFEVLHGNEDSFREMLRIKRSVQAQYSKVYYNVEEVGQDDEVEELEENPLTELEKLTQT
ncbi:rna-processing protein, putative [Theileria annulata]|uniref:Rna-processing protein, putative n=1 Tax=Theileria annulata TaxID=5874 RepID=Q4UG46_THEAN|nr:rna-processing protein, putative [Theileria annulata]CAI73943.1 rna-processing protein, putative [Theileria annulata]|eukprot:XP_954620.1 rna-processing protein, putative [Theileria annulata]